MRYFLVAGEASGDNLGALLVDEIRALDPAAEFAFWGGDGLAAATGVAPRQHLRDLAFMGFAEVVANLPTILRLMRRAKADVAAYAPDVLVCIDYPGFNLRLGKWAKARGIRVDFYVSPQIWAWRRGRVHKVIASTHRVLTILPFEAAFYASYGYEVSYTGHPLPKRIDHYTAAPELRVRDAAGARTVAGPVLALLPGSRQQEVRALLPVMLAAAEALLAGGIDVTPVVAAAPTLSDDTLLRLSRKHGVCWSRSSYAVLAHARLACVASGTATLETALFGVPQVVCYRAGAVSVALARHLIKVPYIALVNLILDGPVVPELIQDALTPEALAAELRELAEGDARAEQLGAYEMLRAELAPYEAARAAAELVVADAQAVENRRSEPSA